MNKDSFECMMMNAELKDAYMDLADDLRNLREVGEVMESCQLGLDFLSKCDSKAAVEALHDIDVKLVTATIATETLSESLIAAWNKFVDFIKNLVARIKGLFTRSIPMQIEHNNKRLLELKNDIKLLSYEGLGDKMPIAVYNDVVDELIKWCGLGAEAINYLHKVNSSITMLGKVICTGYGEDAEKQLNAVIFSKDSYLQKADDVLVAMMSVRDGIKEAARGLGKVDMTKKDDAIKLLDKFVECGQSYSVDIKNIVNLQQMINLDKTLPKLEAISVGVTPNILNLYRTGMICCCRSLLRIGKMYSEMSDINEKIANKAFS